MGRSSKIRVRRNDGLKSARLSYLYWYKQMAMGIVNAEEFEKEVNYNVVERALKHGRGSDVKNTPMVIRQMAAEAVIQGASIKETALTLGISESSVSAYKNGATSTSSYHEPVAELVDSNNTAKRNVRNIATDKLLAALDSITVPEIQLLKVKDRATIAQTMSAIVKNTQDEAESGNRVNIIVYQPRVREEDTYDKIDVNE